MNINNIMIWCCDGETGQTLFPHKITYQKTGKIVLDFSAKTGKLHKAIGEIIRRKIDE
jgi:hypothetical protein